MAQNTNLPPVEAKLKDGETVSARMYRGILGDFFVLTHAIETSGSGSSVYRALIDCGALQCIGSTDVKKATAASLKRLEQCIADVLDEDPHFDLVIATHEHYDHLSGFVKYHNLFAEKGFSVGELWLAWTENDADELAVEIRAGRSKGLEALNALVADDDAATSFGLDVKDSKVQGQIEGLRNLLQFNDEPDPEGAKAFADQLVKPASGDAAPRKKPRSCRDALNWLKQCAGEANVRYLDPGEQVDFGIGKRLRATVLGPPRTRERLLKMDPSKGETVSEVYLTERDDYVALLTNMSTRQQLTRGRAAMAGEREELASDVEIFVPVDTDSPFANFGPGAEVKLVDVKRGKTTVKRADSEWRVAELYFDPDNESRRIDGDWLGVAQTLALKIDGDVNNTSLALAFEVPGRHVLLFPADAQVGNWQSWHDQKYPSQRGVISEGGETAAEILSRVVLYKVGHHGSHNATASALGLEMMTSPHLAAMIPVVEEVAAEQKTSSNPDGWAMPYDKLYTRLKVKTSQRIVRGDDRQPAEDESADRKQRLADGWAGVEQAFKGSIFRLGYADDNPADPIWVSLTLGAKDPDRA